MLRNFILVVFVFFCRELSAQELPGDSSAMEEVLIQANRYKLFSAGVNKTSFDSSAIRENFSNNLTELLTTRSSVYIKDYGAGTLATIAFRGTSANQTQVTWNGFPVNSSANGVVDFSTIPVSQIDRITLIHGGSGSLYGSSAIGGSVQLDNNPSWEQGTSVMLSNEAGSFGTWRPRAKVITGNKRVESNTNLYYNSAQNNYPFVNTTVAGSPVIRLSNAALTQYGFMQSLYLKAGKNNTFSAGAWYQNSERHIPPLMFTTNSQAIQNDSSFRTYARWIKKYAAGSFILRSAYFSEYLRYRDPQSNIDSKNLVNKTMTEAEHRHSFADDRIKTNLGAGISYAEGNIKEFGHIRSQLRGAVFGGVKYASKTNLQLDLTLRKEFSAGYQPPLSPAAGLEKKWKIGSDYIIVKSSITRNYRLPTLNERYYQPGGNANLKPESGWSEEAGLRHIKGFGHASAVETELTVFTSVINNWIQWAPVTGTIWSPLNLKKVWARGFELKSNSSFMVHHVKLDLSANYAYTVSTNLEAYTADQKSTIGKQLIYVPYNNFNFSFRTEFRRYFLSYNQALTGFRYTSPENDEFIKGFAVGNVYGGKRIKKSFGEIYLQFKVTNIWNVSYQTVAWAPMPGRAYYLTLQFELNNRK
ncbi:MAG: TonB-dependent receptor plug domain-containing protein [Cytophagaceae bacterium]